MAIVIHICSSVTRTFPKVIRTCAFWSWDESGRSSRTSSCAASMIVCRKPPQKTIRRPCGTLGRAPVPSTNSSAPISVVPVGRGWPSQSTAALASGVTILFKRAVAVGLEVQITRRGVDEERRRCGGMVARDRSTLHHRGPAPVHPARCSRSRRPSCGESGTDRFGVCA